MPGIGKPEILTGDGNPRICVTTHVANVLVRAAQTAKLPGTQVVLTGSRSQIAQSLVPSGVNLGDIVT